MRGLPPEYTIAIFNLLLIVVMGVIAWLVKRAVTATDRQIEIAVAKIEEMAKVLGEVRVMIAGDLYPRKEHTEFARHMEEQLNLLRTSVHDLRDSIQQAINKVAVLEAIVQKRKHVHS